MTFVHVEVVKNTKSATERNMIFRVLKIKNMVRDARENPGNFASSQVGDLFMGMFIMPIISAVLLLGGLFILGFTEILGGPYSFFRFFFWLSIFCMFFFFYILRKMYKLVKSTTKGAVDQTIKVESKVVE
ncbi:MAG: hypothetical protein QG583_511 [Patescibacteria group bacterium]|nr:hypothetical protein [Patescibacteria group bacterium]